MSYHPKGADWSHDTNRRRRRSNRQKKGRLGQAAPIGRLVENFIESSGMGQDVGLAFCRKFWSEVCGSDLAGRSRPIRMDASILMVTVEDSICFQELTMKKHDLLALLSERISFGTKPSDIQFVMAAPGDRQRR